jgi:DNA-directed RNA polymerase specialized sigma subunit
MYRLSAEPPEMPMNDYILQYQRTRDEKYLAYFLHVYEPKLNYYVERQCSKYRQSHRFGDVKLAVIETMMTKLPQYDSKKGASFLTFVSKFAKDAIHGFIRQNGGVFSARPREYRTMKKVIAIYDRHKDEPKEEWLREIWQQTGLSDKDIEKYINMAKQFRFPVNVDESTENQDSERLNDYRQVADIYSSPERIVLNAMRYDDMVDELEKLPDEERQFVLDYLGIRCLYCGRIGDKKPLSELADDMQLRDNQSVTARFRKLIGILAVEMEKLGWIEGENTPKLTEKVEEPLRQKLRIY